MKCGTSPNWSTAGLGSVAGHHRPAEDHRGGRDMVGRVEPGRDGGGIVAVGLDAGEVGAGALGQQQAVQHARLFQRRAGRAAITRRRQGAGEAVAGVDVGGMSRDRGAVAGDRGRGVAVQERRLGVV
jgi:hypothetical protein